MSTIYALLVGIDKYQPPVPALDGCVNDMRAFRDFLVRRANRNGMDIQLEVLENDQATRLGIVQKFTHLTQAKEGDIAVFYYSGHGSQEPSHEAFHKIESDKLNETLVCYDSRSYDGMDLADKELATLLSTVAENNPHLLVVTDCCNSGENTRSVGLAENEVKVRQSPDSKALRPLDSYIMPRSMNPATRGVLEIEEELNIVIPQARHVHFAATHSHQLAKETHLGGSPRGVFTYSLLEVLENALGPITYQDVIRRVRSLVRKRTFEQDPQMSVFHTGDGNLEFLNGSVSIDSKYYSVEHSREKGWTIDAGSIQGIVPGNFYTNENTLLNVFASDASDAEMNDATKALGQVSVADVSATSSTLRLEGELWLDTNTTYRARISQMPVEQTTIMIRGEAAGVQLAKAALAGDDQASVFLKETNIRSEAQYHLIATAEGEFIIVRAMDADDQPLVEQLVGINEENAQKAIDYLEHISKWERTLELNNPSSGIFANAVRIELCPVNDDTPMIPADGNYSFSYRAADGPNALPRFRVKIVNTSGRDLYCSLLYLSAEFEVNAGLLHNKGIWVKNGEEAWAIEGRAFRGVVPDELYSFGKREVESHFKLIYNTKDFDASLMEQASLKMPKPRMRSLDDGEVKSRNLMFDSNLTVAKRGDDWNATELSVLIRRED